ncbi:MAG: acetyltransferase [Bacteroidales bacterium]|nr:acetyltransferase [Bacteroidales bacterium]
MKEIAIYGVGGFGREVLTLIQDINRQRHEWKIIGFFDDGYPEREMINGFPTLGGMSSLNNWDKEISVAIAIGNPATKKKIVNNICNRNVLFPSLIHPSVQIGDDNYVQIGKGCIICAENLITTNIVIGDFVILNLACTTGHDTTLGDYSAFMPSVNISGEVHIGSEVYVGTGAKIINQINIGEQTIVGAGAVVAKDLPARCTAVGVPARPIKQR